MDNWKFLADEALPTITSSAKIFFQNAAIFPGAALPTRAPYKIVLTIRTATVYIRDGDGTQTASSTNGHDYAVGNYVFYGGLNELKNLKAISATGTGFITYYQAA